MALFAAPGLALRLREGRERRSPTSRHPRNLIALPRSSAPPRPEENLSRRCCNCNCERAHTRLPMTHAEADAQRLLADAQSLLTDLQTSRAKGARIERLAWLVAGCCVALLAATAFSVYRVGISIQDVQTTISLETRSVEAHVRQQIVTTGSSLLQQALQAFTLYNFSVPTTLATMLTGNFSDLAAAVTDSSNSIRYALADVRVDSNMKTLRSLADVSSAVAQKLLALSPVPPVPGSMLDPSTTSNNVLSIVDQLIGFAKTNVDWSKWNAMGQVCTQLADQLGQISFSARLTDGSWDANSSVQSVISSVRGWCAKAQMLNPANFTSEVAYDAWRMASPSSGYNAEAFVYRTLNDTIASFLTVSNVSCSPTSSSRLPAGSFAVSCQFPTAGRVVIILSAASTTVWPRQCTVYDPRSRATMAGIYAIHPDGFELAWNVNSSASVPPTAFKPSPSNLYARFQMGAFQQPNPFVCNGFWQQGLQSALSVGVSIARVYDYVLPSVSFYASMPSLSIPFGTCQQIAVPSTVDPNDVIYFNISGNPRPFASDLYMNSNPLSLFFYNTGNFFIAMADPFDLAPFFFENFAYTPDLSTMMVANAIPFTFLPLTTGYLSLIINGNGNQLDPFAPEFELTTANSLYPTVTNEIVLSIHYTAGNGSDFMVQRQWVDPANWNGSPWTAVCFLYGDNVTVPLGMTFWEAGVPASWQAWPPTVSGAGGIASAASAAPLCLMLLVAASILLL